MATQVGYDPLKFRAVVNGVPVFDPADIDDALKASYDEDKSRAVVGMYGDAAIEWMVSDVGTFTITLKAKSPTNAQFTALYQARRQFSIKFVNRNTNLESAFCLACAVKTVPELAGGTASPDREWVFTATELRLNLDGHKTIPGL